MPAEKSFDFHRDARRVRDTFYADVKPLTEQLDRTLRDPDLNDEAKARRSAPIRKQIHAKAESARGAMREIAARARRRELDVAPERLRQSAALNEPGRTAEYIALFASLPLPVLASMAEQLAEAAKPDRAAMFALAQRVRTFTETDSEAAAALVERLDRTLDGDVAEVRADRLVAEHEAMVLELDAEAALGQRLDPFAALSRANTLGATDAEIANAYAALQAERTTQYRHDVPERSAQALEQLGALERLLANAAPDDEGSEVGAEHGAAV